MSRPLGSKNKSTMQQMQAQVEELPLGDSSETDDEIDKRIRKTYRVFEKVTNGMVSGAIRGAIVTGASGCGKSYHANEILREAADSKQIMLRELSGASSAVGLYKELYKANQGPDNLVRALLIDDCDIYHDLEAISVLKRALNTGTQSRTISWNKESYPLINAGIELSFDFTGSCLFLTNKDFVKEISYNGKMSPHYTAFLNRCIFLDLGIHSKREILIRIKQVARDGGLFDHHRIEPVDGQKILEWITNNLAKIRVVSFNTVLALHSMIKMGDDWQEMAEVTLFNR